MTFGLVLRRIEAIRFWKPKRKNKKIIRLIWIEVLNIFPQLQLAALAENQQFSPIIKKKSIAIHLVNKRCVSIDVSIAKTSIFYDQTWQVFVTTVVDACESLATKYR